MKYALILLVAITAACTNQSSPDSDQRSVADSQSTESQKPARILVERHGDPSGRTVLFIPGLASSADLWDDTVAAVGDTLDVRTVQIAGFAGADAPQDTAAVIDPVVAAIGAHLKQVPGRDTMLVGHSIGGLIAMKLAASAPNIDEIFIIDSLPFLAALFIPSATPESAAQTAPRMAAQMAAAPREAFDAQQAAGLARLAKTTSFHSTLQAWGEASDQQTVATAFGEALATDFRSDLAEIQADATVLVPWDNAMPFGVEATRSFYARQYAALDGVKIVMVEDSLHFVMIEQPGAFKAAITTAIAD